MSAWEEFEITEDGYFKMMRDVFDAVFAATNWSEVHAELMKRNSECTGSSDEVEPLKRMTEDWIDITLRDMRPIFHHYYGKVLHKE